MNIPKLKKIKSEKKYHNISLSDDYSWVDQPDILEVLKDANKLDPEVKEFIKEFESITKCSVLVNTSFNVRGEPIVCNIEDAFNCFMGTNIDILVIENFVLFKNDQDKKLTNNYKDQFELD